MWQPRFQKRFLTDKLLSLKPKEGLFDHIL